MVAWQDCLDRLGEGIVGLMLVAIRIVRKKVGEAKFINPVFATKGLAAEVRTS